MTLTIHLGFSPYHAFLACCQAAESGAADRLVLVADGGGVDELAAALAAPASPLGALTVLPGPTLDQPLPLRVARLAVNRLAIRRILRRLVPDEVVVYNDLRPESQTALDWVRRSSGRSSAAYAEDGLTVYSGERFEVSLHPAMRLLRRLLYGRGWRERAVQGTAPELAELRLVVPELVRPELAHRKLRSLPLGAPAAPAVTEVARLYLAAMGLSPPRLADLPHRDLLLLPLCVGAAGRRRLLADLSSIRDLLASAEPAPLVKYHPREASGDYLDAGAAGAPLLPRRLGVEFLFAVPETAPRRVIGAPSTALITARRLLPDRPVHFLSALADRLDPSLAHAFRHLDIRPWG